MHLKPRNFHAKLFFRSVFCKPNPSCLHRRQERLHFSSRSISPIISPCRVQKLIASQSDPLLATQIFYRASRQPNFRHSYSSYLIIILKLGRAKYFSVIDRLLVDLRSKHYPLTPTLFAYLIRLFGEAGHPDKALKTFYSITDFGCTPVPKHLNGVLEVLVSSQENVRTAFELFKTADKHGVLPNTQSYNIMIRAYCRYGKISVAYRLFNQMFKRDILPDVESYRILIQALCRKRQVKGAADLLEDMLNKGYVPDFLCYTTLLNSLCRKKELKEAYKLLCRMKMKGCKPDIIHYNTLISGFCREGRAMDACKILDDMESNTCFPDLVSYRTLIGGLCDAGCYDKAMVYLKEMLSTGLAPHFSISHSLTHGLCNRGELEKACSVLEELLGHGEVPHVETWKVIVSRVCDSNDFDTGILEEFRSSTL